MTAGGAALLDASRTGDDARVRELIAADSMLIFEADSVTGDTALHLAAANGHAPLVHTLLRAGAPRTARNAAGETPAEAPRRSGVLDDDEIEAIAQLMANVQAAPDAARAASLAASSSLRAAAVEFRPAHEAVAANLGGMGMGVGDAEPTAEEQP